MSKEGYKIGKTGRISNLVNSISFKQLMIYKVTFENNVPRQALEAKDGVVQKKYIIENGVNFYDWVLVHAETEEAALLKARDIEQKVNKEQK